MDPSESVGPIPSLGGVAAVCPRVCHTGVGRPQRAVTMGPPKEDLGSVSRRRHGTG